MPEMIIILFILTVTTIATITCNVQKTIAPFHGHGNSPGYSPQIGCTQTALRSTARSAGKAAIAMKVGERDVTWRVCRQCQWRWSDLESEWYLSHLCWDCEIAPMRGGACFMRACCSWEVPWLLNLFGPGLDGHTAVYNDLVFAMSSGAESLCPWTVSVVTMKVWFRFFRNSSCKAEWVGLTKDKATEIHLIWTTPLGGRCSQLLDRILKPKLALKIQWLPILNWALDTF